MESLVDSNNNASGGKYCLRPRNVTKWSRDIPEEEEVTPTCRRARRSSPRGLSLSKYRRKSANARERSRMREINAAFEALRRVVGWQGDGQGEKATKISTLRLAMRHISALRDALQEPDLSLATGSSTYQHNLSSSSLSNYNPPGFEHRTPDSSFVNGSSPMVYPFPTHYSPTGGSRLGLQRDSLCDNLSDSRSDSDFSSVRLTPTSPSFIPCHVTSLGHHTPSFLPDALPAPPQALEDSLLPSDTLPSITFEELFIT